MESGGTVLDDRAPRSPLESAGEFTVTLAEGCLGGTGTVMNRLQNSKMYTLFGNMQQVIKESLFLYIA